MAEPSKMYNVAFEPLPPMILSKFSSQISTESVNQEAQDTLFNEAEVAVKSRNVTKTLSTVLDTFDEDVGDN